MGKFADLMKDPTVVAVRKAVWVNPNDRLYLPPVMADGHRGAWCVLQGHDGVDPNSRTNVLAIMCQDDADDWSEWKEPAP